MGAVHRRFPSLTDRQAVTLAVRDFEPLARCGELTWSEPRAGDGAGRENVTYRYPSVEEIRTELAGRDLACWCPLDQPCHADVLLEIANGVPPAGGVAC